MAAGTVAYTDTTGNRDYLGMIAGQIGRRLKEASDMASDERAYAERKAEEGGTSLDEAGIGKGYFFKRALGSRFGGDRIARTKGRMGMGGAGTNPTGNFKTRFRGGFDYNVTNEIQASTLPLSSALSAGLRGVEGGLVAVGQSIEGLARGMNDLARAQEDAARQAIMNGAFMQAFLNFMQREASRQGARREESGLERGRLTGNRGLLGGRGMINVTPGGGGRGGGGGSTSNALLSFGTSQLLGKGTATKAGMKVASDLPAAVKAVKSGSGIGKFLGKAATSEEIVSTAGKLITGDVIPEPLMKSIDDMVPGFGKVMPKIFSGDSMRGAAMSLEATEKMAQATSRLQQELGPEASKLLDDLMYGDFGAKAIRQEDAIKLFEYIKKGGYTGLPMSTEEVLDIMKQGMGEKEYNKLLNGALKGADKPIAKQLGGTVAEQTLKQGLKLKAKAGAKSLIKKLPLIGAIAGVAFGIERALKGDFLGAGLEVTSGLLGMMPGLGSGLGLGIDGFLLARDMGAMPMARGGFLTRPTPVVAGEAGAEGFFPLEGARGKKTFAMFGQGVLDAQEDNKDAVATMYAMGNRKYFDDMGGWSRFGEKIGNFLKGVKENTVGAEDDGYYGPAWLGIKNWNSPRWQNDADNPNKENVTAMSGSGGSLNLSEQDFKWLAYAVSGEARLGTKDEFAVAASILNRAARGDHGGSIEAIIKAPGQYEAYEKGMMNHNPEILNRLMSPSGQSGIVDALRRLDGRTDFKGQTQLHNRVAGEDPMFHRLGNFFHYDYQTGPNSMRPSNYQTPNYQKFIKSSNTGGEAANLLQQMSAQNSMGGMFMPTTIINNNYAAVQGGGGGSEDTFGSAFPSGFTAFTLPYSLASK